MDILESILSRPVKLITISSNESKVTPITKQWTPPPLYRNNSNNVPVVDKKKIREKELKELKEKQKEEENKKKELRMKLIAANRSGASSDVIWKSIKEKQQLSSVKNVANVAITSQQPKQLPTKPKLLPIKHAGYQIRNIQNKNKKHQLKSFNENKNKAYQFLMPVGRKNVESMPVVKNNKIEESIKKPQPKKQPTEPQPKVRYICGIPQPIKRKPEETVRYVENNVNIPARTQYNQVASMSILKDRGGEKEKDRGGEKEKDKGAGGGAEKEKFGGRVINYSNNYKVLPHSSSTHHYYDDWDNPNEDDLDFIDDGPLEEDSWRRELRSITGYNPSKFKGITEECDVSGFDRTAMEERYSTIIANKEDAEQLKLIELEEKREQMMKQLKRRRQH